jgi:hypothetical protein
MAYGFDMDFSGMSYKVKLNLLKMISGILWILTRLSVSLVEVRNAKVRSKSHNLQLSGFEEVIKERRGLTEMDKRLIS